jgi:hypothetical protein
MKNDSNLNRRGFLRTTGRTATALAAVSTFAPAVLSAPSPGKTIGVGCIGLGTRFQVLPEEHNTRKDLPKGYEWGKSPKQPNHMDDWATCIQSRGTPKCSTDEAFIETATFLMSLASYRQQRKVRWDAAREEIV